MNFLTAPPRSRMVAMALSIESALIVNIERSFVKNSRHFRNCAANSTRLYVRAAAGAVVLKRSWEKSCGERDFLCCW